MWKLVVSSLVLVGFTALFATPVLAAEEKTHEGTVVSAAEGKLVMADKEKKEHTHVIADKTKITLNDKAAKLGDLKKGDVVKVTVGEDGKVSAVAATRKAE